MMYLIDAIGLRQSLSNRRHRPTVIAMQFITGPTIGRTHFFNTFFKGGPPGRLYTSPPVGLPSSSAASTSFAARTPRFELCIVIGPSPRITRLYLEIRQKLWFKKFSKNFCLKPAPGHGLSENTKFNPTALILWEPIRLGRTDGQTDRQTDRRTACQFLGALCFDNHPFGI